MAFILSMRNLTIAYTLSFLSRCWFWLGIWIFYYLRFTDYAGIGFLEAVMITTLTVGEIPTGAIADILGKKVAVILAFLLGGLGNLIMAIAPNYWILVVSIMMMTLGSAFYSGSLEALVYDSLKQANTSHLYQKVIGRMTSMQNLGMVFSGIVGGYLYKWHVSLPFLFVASAYLVGLILSFWLIEPIIDTEKYSWTRFIHRNAEGFKQLFANKKMGILVIALLIPGAFMVATQNVLDDATAVELGFSSVQLGIFASILAIFGIVVSEKTEWLSNKLHTTRLYGGSVIIYALTLLLIPKAMFLSGAILLLVRYGTQTFFDNYISIRINAVISSKYRATTLSTFSLLRNIPYVLTATFMGIYMNFYTAKIFSLYFGIIFLLCIVGFYGVRMILSNSLRE